MCFMCCAKSGTEIYKRTNKIVPIRKKLGQYPHDRALWGFVIFLPV